MNTSPFVLLTLFSSTEFTSKLLKYFRPVLLSILLGLMAMPVQAVINIGPLVIQKENTIEVLGPGPDLQGIIDGIGDESAAKPYLIKLGAGEYPITADISTSLGLVMAPYISIMGSGQGTTVLKGAISGFFSGTSAILIGADN